ncbi:MAG TPA: hypothetical protein PK400_03960 [Phycisphaerales bacterium]|nr:hypothetical protein [Phycisphaerales bacterium]HRQ76836.1 hypothetical protein [Phycisphaerales bacterium]
MKTGTNVVSLIVIAALLGGASIAWWIRSGMRAEYDRAMDAWVAAGLAPSLQDLRPAPLPADENAATVYEQAFAILGQLSVEERSTLGDPTGEYARYDPRYQGGADLNEDAHRAAAAALNRATIEKLAPALDLVKQAAAMPQCLWNNTMYDEGMDALMPWIAYGHLLSFALRDRAAHRASEGRLDEAASDLATAVMLANHIGSDPTPISQLVRWSIIEAVLASMETLFRHANHDVPEGPLADLIRQLDLQPDLIRAIEANALMGLSSINRPNVELIEANGIAPNVTPALLVRLWWYRDLDRAYVLDANRELIEWLSAPAHNRAGEPIATETPEHAILGSHFVMESWQIQKLNLRLEQSRLLAVLAMELRAHRRAHGEYPDPETWTTPLDPVTKAPLHYERTETGFRLFAGRDIDPGHLRRMWEWE